MKLGEVIRKYRKEQGMTQEDVAGWLGVTAPAVNKWENGNSLPDVALIAPIARLFRISTDTLLSYEEELTVQEVNRIAGTIGEKLRTEGYEAAFTWAEERIREYPNCDNLILTSAQILDAYRDILKAEHPKQYDEKIRGWYLRALNSPVQDISQAAAVALFTGCLAEKEFDQARQYLMRLPKQGWNPLKLQALLAMKEGDTERAYELYEQLVFSGYSEINWALNGIFSLAALEDDLAKAEKITGLMTEIAKLLEMGKYMEASAGLGLAMYRKDKEKMLEILTQIVSNVKDIDSYKGSDLYSHMKFNYTGKENIIYMLRKGFEGDETVDFIKEDERFKQLLKDLEGMEAG